MSVKLHRLLKSLKTMLRRIIVVVLRWLLQKIQQLHAAAAEPIAPALIQHIHQQEFWQQVIDIVPSSIFIKDKEGYHIAMNQATARMHQLSVNDMLGKRDPDFNPHVSPEQLEEFLATNRLVMQTRQPIQVSQQGISTRTGELRWYRTTISPLIAANGEVLGIVGNAIDITELKQMHEELERLATVDELTQIANRRQFDMRLKQEWQQLAATEQILSLLLFDIDYFKAYNDCYGHQQGDRCLQQVAQVVNQVIRQPALVARYGGEEFAVILPKTSPEAAMTIAERIRSTVQQLNIVHSQSSLSSVITVSVGGASQYPTADHAPAELIQATDRALYQAKRQGRNRVHWEDSYS